MPDPLEQLRTPDEPVAPRDEFRWVLRHRVVEALGVDAARIPVDPANLTYLAQEADPMPTTTTPTTVTAITPYLTVHDAAAAIAFYTDAFGAVEEFRVVGDDGRVGHAELRIGSARIELSDEYPEIDVRSPRDLGGSTFALSLTVADCDAVFARALAAGGTEERAPADQPHGNRMAVVRDPFGHRWNLLQPIEQFDLETYAERTKDTEFEVVSGPGASALASRRDYGERVSPDGLWAIVNYADPLGAIRFVVDVLGFREHLVVQDNDDPTIVHHSELHWPEGGVLQISTLQRPGRGSMYTQQSGLPPYVITLDPESVLARCEAAGVEVVSPMEYVPYGVPGDRGFTVRDPEGNLWAVGTYGATVR